jgi:hypothetical protein
MKSLSRPSFMAATCFALIALNANANLLTNGSFELGSFVNQGNQTMSLAAGATTMTGWTAVGRSLAWINTGNPWSLSAQDGNFFLDLTDYNAGAPFGGVTQSIPTVLGQQYTLSFELGSYTQLWGGPPTSVLVSAAGASQTFTDATITTKSTWTPFSFTFTATSTTTAVTLLGAAGVNYIGLDNVSLDAVGGTAVPEPASYALLGLALVMFFLIARWRFA